MKDLYIVPECYVDTNLVESLLVTDGVNHQKGCYAVANAMKSRSLNDTFAVGVIDFDTEKTQPTYVREFAELAHSQHLILMKHNSKPHYLVMIKPAMDQFILDSAKEQGVSLFDFDLSSNLEDFKKQTKTVDSKYDIRFKNLFKTIKGNPEITILCNVLNYLKEKRYQSKVEELKLFFAIAALRPAGS